MSMHIWIVKVRVRSSSLNVELTWMVSAPVHVLCQLERERGPAGVGWGLHSYTTNPQWSWVHFKVIPSFSLSLSLSLSLTLSQIFSCSLSKSFSVSHTLPWPFILFTLNWIFSLSLMQATGLSCNYIQFCIIDLIKAFNAQGINEYVFHMHGLYVIRSVASPWINLCMLQ